MKSESSDEAFLAAGSTLPLAPSDHGLQGDQAQVRLAEDGRAWVEQDPKQSQLVIMSCPQARRRRSVQAPRASQGGWEPTSPSSLERGWVWLVQLYSHFWPLFIASNRGVITSSSKDQPKLTLLNVLSPLLIIFTERFYKFLAWYLLNSSIFAMHGSDVERIWKICNFLWIRGPAQSASDQSGFRRWSVQPKLAIIRILGAGSRCKTLHLPSRNKK